MESNLNTFLLILIFIILIVIIVRYQNTKNEPDYIPSENDYQAPTTQVNNSYVYYPDSGVYLLPYDYLNYSNPYHRWMYYHYPGFYKNWNYNKWRNDWRRNRYNWNNRNINNQVRHNRGNFNNRNVKFQGSFSGRINRSGLGQGHSRSFGGGRRR